MTEPARTFDADQAPALTPPEALHAAAAGPGARLGEERRRQGLSLGDIARQLKLSVRQIEALERDDYPAFSGMVFVRGFLRNYAKLLQLDADALVAQLPPSAGAAPAAPGTPAPVAVDASVPAAAVTGARPGRPGLGWLAGAVVLALLVAAAIYEGRRHEAPGQLGHATPQPLPGGALSPQHADSPPPGTAAPAVPALATPAVEPARSATAVLPASAVISAGGSAAAVTPPGSSAAPAMASMPQQPANPLPTAAPPAAPVAQMPAAPAPGTAVPNAAAPNVAVPARTGTASAPAPGSETGPLRLKFQAEAWVEVKDGSGAVLFSRLGSPGSEEVVQGRAPLSLVVGNAHAVQVTYQGRLVDLGPHTRVDVARLVLE
jgi:cytoskeleton protein RodZ